MNGRVVQVRVPDPHEIGLGGPEWKFSGVFGDDMRVCGVPAGEDAPASVALYVAEDVEPFPDVDAYFAPAVARQIAGALIAAAEHAERRWTR